MLHRLIRVLKHRWLDASDVHRQVPAEMLQRLTQRVHASEQQHTGQIRLCIEASLPSREVWHQVSVRQRAVDLFGRLRVWDTEHNNGVLIYLLLSDHAIELVADRGLQARVAEPEWQALVSAMGSHFQQGHMEQGLNHAIDQVTAMLIAHVPRLPGQSQVNEQADAPVLM